MTGDFPIARSNSKPASRVAPSACNQGSTAGLIHGCAREGSLQGAALIKSELPKCELILQMNLLGPVLYMEHIHQQKGVPH